MRATGDREAVRILDPYLTALQAARPANSVLHWLRISRTSAAPILRELLTGVLPITHDTLDHAPSGHATEFLRAALVKHGALAERDEICHRFERWIITTTDPLPDHPDRANLRRWATWTILRDLRGRRQASPAASDHGARSHVRVARDFVAWLHQQQLTLATTGQHDVDRWVTDGTTTRCQIRPFLRWSSKTKLTPPLDASVHHNDRQGTELADSHRRRLITQLLTNPELELRTRVAGLLILLYGQPLARITRLRVADIHHDNDQTSITLGRDRLALPAPIDQLVRELAAAPQGSTLHDHTGDGWLFPGQLAGAPITPERLRRRLVQQLAPLPIRHGRHSAITGQLRQQPARPDDLLLGPGAGQQLVNDIVRELAADLVRHAVQDPRRGRRLAWRLAGAHPD